MSLINKDKKKKPLKVTAHGAAAAHGSSKRPAQVVKHAPCSVACPCGTEIREWLALIAQRGKQKIGDDEALTAAFEILVNTNPFPSVLGRVCPHPCERQCNRIAKDGAVSINALERFIGDWSLERKLPLPRLELEEKPESIGVVGAGPAGLSFAYQMARRGYRVTIYEATHRAGGMLYWGIPFYRLPAQVLQAEIDRVIHMGGIEIKFNTSVGKDIASADLRNRHQVIFISIGAHKGRALAIAGEAGKGAFTGVDYLRRVANGETIDLGKSVAVIGGGDTAIDAARMARRARAEVTILYRRTRGEMPAIDSEIEDALKEGVRIDYLSVPIEVKRDGDEITSVVVQKTELGEPDDSGRRRPIPVEGSEYEIKINAIIAAIAQDPDYEPLGEFKPDAMTYAPDATGKVKEGVWAGGDALTIGIAAAAIGHGRRAAQAVHAQLRGLALPQKSEQVAVGRERIKVEAYESKARAQRARRPVEQWLSEPDLEIDRGITREGFFDEVARCFSCGLCYGCERCWMFCTPSCFVKVEEPRPGRYYTIALYKCDGCEKCAAECPCGFLDIQ
jgi:NADPH-dependent glutamate synthase beta subunit-like oxidoreductase